MEQNAKALKLADKIEKEQQEGLLNPSRSIFDLLKPRKQLEESTTPKPILERLFEPFLGPVKTKLDLLTKDLQLFDSSTTSTTAVSSRNDLSTNLFGSQATSPLTPVRMEFSVKNATVIEQTKPLTTAAPFLTFLEALDHNMKRYDEVGVRRDRTVNVLGMPIGRRDGISLTPLKGLSAGNEDMFGPIAVHDKYNVNWGFFNSFDEIFNKAAIRY